MEYSLSPNTDFILTEHVRSPLEKYYLYLFYRLKLNFLLASKLKSHHFLTEHFLYFSLH